MPDPLLIGLTGGIASGKSTVAKLLKSAKIDVIDADVLAREVVAAGSDGLAAICARFGEDVLDIHGNLDRPKLGALVFQDEQARRDLNAIVHPRVAAAAVEKCQSLFASGKSVVVYEAPLLFENQLHLGMNGTILVDIPPDVQLERLQKRDGFTLDEAKKRIQAQMPREAKLALATVIVDNSGDTENTKRQLVTAWRLVTGTELVF